MQVPQNHLPLTVAAQRAGKSRAAMLNDVLRRRVPGQFIRGRWYVDAVALERELARCSASTRPLAGVSGGSVR